MSLIGQFFAMGGYAAFVWPAYGLTALVFALLVIMTIKGHAKARDEVARLEKGSGK